MEEPLKVLIADDHELVRRGLRMVLDAEPGIEVVAESGLGAEAADLAPRLAPDILLLDLRLPDLDGTEVCRRVRAAAPDTKVLILTSFGDDNDVFGALASGACGYIMKDCAPEALIQAIRGVAAGQTVLDPSIAQRVIESCRAPARGPEAFGLSRREHEVLTLMAQGLANKEIGRALWISESTVKTHVSSLLRKLDVPDRTQAVLHAVREGLVEQTP